MGWREEEERLVGKEEGELAAFEEVEGEAGRVTAASGWGRRECREEREVGVEGRSSIGRTGVEGEGIEGEREKGKGRNPPRLGRHRESRKMKIFWDNLVDEKGSKTKQGTIEENLPRQGFLRDREEGSSWRCRVVVRRSRLSSLLDFQLRFRLKHVRQGNMGSRCTLVTSELTSLSL